MLGSASKIKAGNRACALAGAAAPHSLTCPAQWDSEGTRRLEGCPTVLVVSPYLKLIERIQRTKVGYGREGINRPKGPCAETGGTGAKVSAVFGETTGAGHTRDSWDTSTRGQSVTVQE